MEQKIKCGRSQCYKCDRFHAYGNIRPRVHKTLGYCNLQEQRYHIPSNDEVCLNLKETIHDYFNETREYLKEWEDVCCIRRALQNDIDDYIMAEYWAERITCI